VPITWKARRACPFTKPAGIIGHSWEPAKVNGQGNGLQVHGDWIVGFAASPNAVVGATGPRDTTSLGALTEISLIRPAYFLRF